MRGVFVVRRLRSHPACRLVSAVLALLLSVGTVVSNVSVALAEEASASSASGTPSHEPSSTVVRELTQLRTESSNTYELSDGSRRAEIFSEPIRFKDKTGVWQEIDTDLVRSPLGGYVTSAASLPVEIASSSVSKEPPVSLERDGWSVGITMSGALMGSPIVLGNQATYAAVAPDTDLVYEARGDGVKETLVLSSPSAPTEFTFDLTLKGLRVVQGVNGTWELVKPGETTPTAEIGALTVFDSTPLERGGPVPCEAAAMSVAPTAGGATITYSLPKSWLSDPARTFPVMVDPSIWLYQGDGVSTTADTYTCSAYGYTSYWDSEYLACGTNIPGAQYRAYARFGVQSVIPTNATVSDAEFKLYQYTGTAGQTIAVARPTAWWGATTSWLDMPPQTYLGTVSGPANTWGWIDYHCGSLVQDWVDGDVYNWGLVFYAGSGNFRSFRSREYSDSGARPHLLVTFTVPTPDPVQASATTASSAWFTETDANADLVPDTGNDSTDQGRGSVSLSWTGDADAGGYHIYLHDGNTFRQVGSTTSTSWTTSGANVYPTDSAIAALSANYSGNPFAQGSRDLRDDPNALYKKTAGSSLDATHEYLFKVVPFDTWGTEIALSSCETLTVGLENRTKRVNDAPRHATYDLGQIMHHAAAVELDSGALEFDVSDLAIASWGPEAALSRHYSSESTASTKFAPGWRFNFERALTVNGNRIDYVDEAGDAHAFRYDTTSTVWVSPVGDFTTLTKPTADTYRLTYKDRSFDTFDAAGKLVFSTDARSNETTYTWDAGDLTISAPNGQSIFVDMDGSGTVTSARYATADGTRTVSYSLPSSTEARVLYFAGTSDEYESVYRYGDSGASNLRLTEYAVPGFEWGSGPDSEARWSFGYDATGKFSTWQLMSSTWPTQENSVTWGSGSADIVQPGDVTSTETYTWTPAGTLSSRTTATGGTYSYAYNWANLQSLEHTPLGHETQSSYDERGNLTAETDEDGTTTRSVYDGQSQLTSTIDPAGGATYYSYDTSGNLTLEEQVLNDAGERSRVTYSHNTSGTVTGEVRTISATESAATSYTAFAPNGEPQTTIQRGVKLSLGGPDEDLTSTRSYDAFGNLSWDKDATGRWKTKLNVWSISGRLASSEVVTGTVTHHTYNKLGVIWDTRTTSGTTTVDWTKEVHDARGLKESVISWDGADFAAAESSEWDSRGLVRQTDYFPDGGTRHFAYDAEGRVTKEWAPGTYWWDDAKATRTTYDAEGNALVVVAPGASEPEATTTTYTPDGKILQQTSPDGTWVAYDYDTVGNQTALHAPSEDGTATTTSAYDLAGRVRGHDGCGRQRDDLHLRPGLPPDCRRHQRRGRLVDRLQRGGLGDLQDRCRRHRHEDLPRRRGTGHRGRHSRQEDDVFLRRRRQARLPKRGGQPHGELRLRRVLEAGA